MSNVSARHARRYVAAITERAGTGAKRLAAFFLRGHPLAIRRCVSCPDSDTGEYHYHDRQRYREPNVTVASHGVIKSCLIFQRCCFMPARRSFESERCRDPLYRMFLFTVCCHKSSKSGREHGCAPQSERAQSWPRFLFADHPTYWTGAQSRSSRAVALTLSQLADHAGAPLIADKCLAFTTALPARDASAVIRGL